MAYLSIHKTNEVVLKKKKPLTQLLIPQTALPTNSFADYADRHRFGRVDLSTGNVSKCLYPSFIRSQIICICTLHESNDKNFCVIGLLNSGELFLYNAGVKSLHIIQGPSNLMIPDEYKSKTQSMSSFQTLHTFAKNFFDKNDSKPIEVEVRQDKESDEEIFCTFRPVIFGSPDLSKVFLIGSYSKICLWQRTQMVFLEGKTNNFRGLWKTFTAPATQPSPTKLNRIKLCEVSFITKGSTGPLCYIYFGFMTDDLIVLSTLVVRWNVSTAFTRMDPSSCWKQIKIPLKDIEAKANISYRKGALVAKASHESTSYVLCLNTSASKFYLIYVTAENESSISVVSALYPPVSRGMNYRRHWVVALNWSEDNSFVIGCLKSGHVFISTRMGNLLQICCKNLPQLSEPTNFLPLIENFNEKDIKDSDISESSSHEISESSRSKFSISSNLSQGVFMILSGIRVFIFNFPKDLRNAKEASSYLLQQSHLANHELQNLCSEHQYDYIHCSSWRLAKSLLNLNDRDKNEDQQVKNSLRLWLPGTLLDQKTTASVPLTNLERQMTETFKFIQSSWAFLASSKKLSGNQKRSLTKAAISETLKLLETILVASPAAGDHEEHQVRLIQTLRLFHQIVKTVEANACPMHMIKPILKLTTKYFRLVLSSAKKSSEMMLAYILVLTQTLISVESTLDQSNVFIFHRTKTLWFYLYKYTIPLWKQALLTDSEQFHLKLRSVTGIIQARVLDLREFRTYSVDRQFKTLIGGKLKSGIQKLMGEIVKILKSSSFSKKKLQKYISYGFYSLVINNDLRTLVEFVRWCFEQLSEFYASAKCKSDGKMENKIQNILQSTFGNLGILIAKSLLTSTPDLQEVLLNISTSIPSEFLEDFRGMQLEAKNSTTPAAAIFCLIIGEKWNSVYFLANAFGDTKLSLFAALLATNHNERSRVEDVLKSAISSYMRKDNLSYELCDYKTIQDLLQAASMLEVEILPAMLDECVERMEELLLELPFIVNDDFKLPSPPWFCPQFEIDQVHSSFNEDWIYEAYSCHKEILIRRESSSLIYLFTVLISASGLTHIFIENELEDLKVNSFEEFEISFDYSTFRLKRLDKNELQSSKVWKDLLSTWRKFLGIVRLLQFRDKVSVKLREWSLIKVNITQVSNLQEQSWELLKLCYETFCFQNNNSWRTDLLRIILTAAFDAPPNEETVTIVAAVVSQMKPIPSLMKQKLDYLLEFWKKIKLKTNEHSRGKEAPSLFEYFECQFGKYFNSEIATWPNFENLEGRIEAFASFISMTLLKLDDSFETSEVPYPFLCQFGSRIRELESSCLRLVTNLINYPRNGNDDNTSVTTASKQNFCFMFDDQIPSKKGFFKNTKAYPGNRDKLGTAILYVRGDSSLLPTQRRPRRHSAPYLKGKMRTSKKRRSSSLNSADEGTLRQEVKLKSVTVSENENSQATEATNLITRLFFSAPSFALDFALTKSISEALLWIADEKRSFTTTASRMILNEEKERASLLSDKELRQSLKWLSLYRGSKRVSLHERCSSKSETVERGSNLSNSSCHEAKKESDQQPYTIDNIIASATTKAKPKTVIEKQLKAKTTAVMARVNENNSILQMPQKQTEKELPKLEGIGLGSDSNPKQFASNSNSGGETQDQEPNLNNKIINPQKDSNFIHSGPPSIKNVGFWKSEVMPKNSQFQHECNPWEPFSSPKESNYTPGIIVAGVSESAAQIITDPFMTASGGETNYSIEQAVESESSSCSDRSDLSSDVTSQNLNDNTLDDATLSELPQASNIESPGSTNNECHTPSNKDSEIIFANEKKKHEIGKSKSKTNTRPLAFLKIPKIEKLQSELPKWTLREIPSNESKCKFDSAFKFLNVPLFGKEGLIPTEAKGTQSLKLPVYAKVLGPDHGKSMKASFNFNRNIQTHVFDSISNDLVVREVHTRDEKSTQKEKFVQTSEMNFGDGVENEPIKLLSSTHVQTCPVMEREAIERTFFKDLQMEKASDLRKNNLFQNISSHAEDKKQPLESLSELDDSERLQSVMPIEEKQLFDPKLIEKPQRETIGQHLRKDSSTQTTTLNIFAPRTTSTQENIQENEPVSYVGGPSEVPHYSRAKADQLGARQVAVDLCHPIFDAFQESGKLSQVIDIPECVVKKQLEMLKGDLNQPVTNDMEKKLLLNNNISAEPHQIIDSMQSKNVVQSRGVIEGTQQPVHSTNMSQKTTNELMNMFMVGEISADGVCEFFKTSQLEITKAPTDTKGPPAKDSMGPSPKNRLKKLIQEATMTHKDIDAAKGFLSKVDFAIDSAIHQEMKLFDRIRPAAESPMANQSLPNDDVIKRKHDQNCDVISYIEQISPRNLDCLLEAVNEVLNVEESHTTLWSAYKAQLMENADTSENNLQNSDATASPDKFRGSPLLHLDLACFGCEVSPISPPKTSVTSPKTQRREEIRAWMKRKRIQRRKSENKMDCGADNENSAKPFLTGRQIRELNMTSKKQRIQRCEEHSRMRIDDIENLFRHYDEEKRAVLERPKSVVQERSKEGNATAAPSHSLLHVGQKVPKSKSLGKNLNRSSMISVADVRGEVERLRHLLSSSKVRNPVERVLAKPSTPREERTRRKGHLTLIRSRTPPPLDRISEIDSENSNASTPVVSLSSTDSSWNMPADIKNILSKS